VARQVRPVGGLEPAVELGEALDPRHRDEEAPPLPAHLALDAALLVSAPLARDAEERVEPVVGAQGGEPLGLGAVAPPQHPGDERPRVVVPDPGGDPAESRERGDVPFEERLLALGAVRDVDCGSRVAQAQLEHRDLRALAADEHVGKAEVDLRLVARVVERDDRDVDPLEAELAAARTDVPPDRGLRHRRALLVDQALPDPARRVALLAMHRLVLGEPARDRGGVRTDGRLGPLVRLPRRRHGRREGLPDRARVHAVAARQLADRHLFLPVLPTDTLELLHPRQLL
jgi:hypothetical protein